MTETATTHTTSLSAERRHYLDWVEQDASHGLPDSYSESIAWLVGHDSCFTVVRVVDHFKNVWDGKRVNSMPTVYGLTYVTQDGRWPSLPETFVDRDLAEDAAYADNLADYAEAQSDDWTCE